MRYKVAGQFSRPKSKSHSRKRTSTKRLGPTISRERFEEDIKELQVDLKKTKDQIKEVLEKMEISYSDALHKELNLLSYKETDLKRDIKNFTANFEYLEKQV